MQREDSTSQGGTPTTLAGVNRFEYRGVVAFYETDASGRYHWTNALRWAENAEHALLAAAGVPALDVPRRAAEVSFSAPLAAFDPYLVRIGVARIGSSSITFAWEVLRDGEPAIGCAQGSHTIVNVADGRSVPLPDSVRQALAPWTAAAE